MSDMVVVVVPFGEVSLPLVVDEMLREWARCYWVKRSLESHGRCRSLEGRHVSRHPDEKAVAVMPVDVLLAARVEKIVANPNFPRKNHLFLKCHYVLRQNPRATAKDCSVHLRHYGDELKRSVLMVQNNLLRRNFLTKEISVTRMRNIQQHNHAETSEHVDQPVGWSAVSKRLSGQPLT